MLNWVCTKINNIAKVKTISILLFFTFLLMFLVNKVNLPFSVPRINQISGGEGILDMKMYYTSNEAYQLLNNLKEEGRTTYLYLLTCFDFIFPVTYSLSFSLIIAVILRKSLPASSGLIKLCIIPCLAGFFDWLENINILIMLSIYPSFTNISYFSGYFTSAKWTLNLLGVLTIIGGIIFAVITRPQKTAS